MKLGSLFACLFVLLSSLHAADDYPVKMHRPAKKGDRSLSSGRAVEEFIMTFKVNDVVAKSEKREIVVEYVFEMETINVDSVGRTIEGLGKVIKISGTFNGQPITQLAANDRFSMKREKDSPEKIILVNDRPASAEQTQLLQAVISIGAPDAVTDDEVFGTPNRVRVGDEWKIDAEKAIRQAESYGVKEFKPDGISGKAKALDLVETDGKTCLRVHASMEARGGNVPLPNAPAGMTISEIVIKALAEGDFPVDVNDQSAPAQSLMLTMEMNAGGVVKAGADENRMEITVRAKNGRKGSSKPLP